MDEREKVPATFALSLALFCHNTEEFTRTSVLANHIPPAEEEAVFAQIVVE